MKEPFHPWRRRTFREILLREFVHGSNERLNRADGAESITIGLALVPLVWRVPLLYVVAFFIAVGQGLSYPSLTSLVTKASPANEHGSMLGLASGVGSLARFLGPIVCGFLYDVAHARGAFFGGAVLTAIAFVIALRMRKQPLLAEEAG